MPTDTAHIQDVLSRARAEVRKVIIGQEDVIDKALIAIFTGHHALIEGVPGVAKTLLVRTLARVLGCEFNRIQFTPDLMPADITGTSVFNMQKNEFALIKGPVFTTFLLADEINRAPAKTQSALLQAMQERKVTIDRDTHTLSPNFTVFATQNPVEYEGTYPLPEAQKDRFMLKVSMSTPDRDSELLLAQRMLGTNSPEEALAAGAVEAVITADDLTTLRHSLTAVTVREELVAYVVDVVRATRTTDSVLVGAGPRATQALLLASRASAALAGRDFVNPDDVKSMAEGVLGHRIVLRPEYEIEGVTIGEVTAKILEQVAVPEMIVPRSRLLLWVALIVLPFAAVGATLPGAEVLSILLITGLFVAVIVDAVLARGQLAGIRVELPDVVRLQKDRPGTIAVRIQNASLAARLLRIGFAFPREIATETDDRTALLPAQTNVSRLDWTVTPTQRGQFFLDQVYLETVSPLGFWAARKSQSARVELRVYPNLFDERKNVAALFLRRGALGAHAQRQVGQGRDFEKLREYVPGDSYDEIHWKASAKRGHPVTKVFQVERTQEVYVIVDASRLSAREVPLENGPTPTLERFVTAALILGLAAERQGDQFGLITFSDRVLSFVRAKNGAAHYDSCRDRLYTLQPQSVTPDFDELCSFIRRRLRKRALFIILTALDDPVLAENFAKASELISRQHLLLVNMLQPAGAQPLFSDENISGIDDLYRHLGGHLQWHSLRELEKVLQRRGVRLSLLDPQKLAAQLVAQHADVKRRQLL